MKTKYPVIKKLNDFFTTSEEFDDLVGKVCVGMVMLCGFALFCMSTYFTFWGY